MNLEGEKKGTNDGVLAIVLTRCINSLITPGCFQLIATIFIYSSFLIIIRLILLLLLLVLFFYFSFLLLSIIHIYIGPFGYYLTKSTHNSGTPIYIYSFLFPDFLFFVFRLSSTAIENSRLSLVKFYCGSFSF
jgi:hypothetical protein